MRMIARFLSLFVLAAIAAFCINCKGHDPKPKSKEEVQLGKLTKTWNLTSASLGSTNRTADFSNLVLTVTGTFTQQGGQYSYSFTGSRPNPSPWPASGTWTFGPDPTSQLIRLDDQQSMDYSLGTNDTVLTITFTYAGAGFAGSRVDEVAGQWQFVFSKQ